MNMLTRNHCVHTARACNQHALATCSPVHSRYYTTTYAVLSYARPEGSACQSAIRKRL